MTRTFYLLDMHSLIHRAYHAPMDDLNAADGEPTKVTFLVMKMLFKLIHTHKPDCIAATFDTPRHKTFRRRMYPAYKAKRDSTIDPDLITQIERIKSLLKLLGIRCVKKLRYEADDVIATLVDHALAEDDIDVVIVSRDKDLHQLFDIEGRVRMFDAHTEDWFAVEDVRRRWGVDDPAMIIDIQALMGDSTDGVPGVPGVGAKKALALIQQHETALSVAEHAKAGTSAVITPKLREAINATDVTMMLNLVTLVTTVPLKRTTPKSFAFTKLNTQAAVPVFKQLGFKRWSKWHESPAALAPDPSSKKQSQSGSGLTTNTD